jgi:cytochrome c
MLRVLFAIVVVVLAGTPVLAQLRGHGGPVRALAISTDGRSAISGGFDSAAIRWSLERGSAVQILRLHDGAVNAVGSLPDGRVVTSGEDARIAIWNPGDPTPARLFEGHRAPVVALAVSPDGQLLASASWDGTARLWPLGDGTPRVLEGHRQNVNGIAFAPDGKTVVTAGYDASLRIWPLTGPANPIVVTLPAPLNAVVVAPDAEIITAGADGKIYLVSAEGELRGQVEAAPVPLIALALSSDGTLIAAAGIRGSVAIVSRAERKLQRVLVGPGLPVWSASFVPGSHDLLTGGADALIRRWNADSGESIGDVAMAALPDPLAAYADDPGAQVFRACVACHALGPDPGERAGPTLAGIFGRRIATLPGYRFSEALRRLDIVWSPETLARLFEVGPAAYTPGTKMPEQRIGSAADRAALVAFLQRATAPR